MYVFNSLEYVYLGEELLGCTVTPCLTFQGAMDLCSTAAEAFYLPTNRFSPHSERIRVNEK